jgi:dTDP-4-amino-4,6-dideoxygalactose transaminase
MQARAVKQYERAFAAKLGARRAFAFWKGRVAFYAILRALGVGEGDDVIMPGYTCVMAVNPIFYVGARPIFVDIEPATFNIDVGKIEAHITNKTRLIVAQHTYGYTADMRAIMEISRRHGIPVVEDCCLAVGSTYNDQPVGTFGVAAYTSFQWNKAYTTGLGGMAFTNDPELADKIHGICDQEVLSPTRRDGAILRAQLAVYRTCVYPRTTAFAQSLFRFLTRHGLVIGSSNASEYTPTIEPEFLKGMTAAQARAGLGQLRKMERNLEHRKKMAAVYDRLLGERGWPVTTVPVESRPVLVRYPVRVADKPLALKLAARRLVELGSWFESPLHPLLTPLASYGYRPGMCPESDRACREVVNLPVHPRTNERTARRTVAFIADFQPAPS